MPGKHAIRLLLGGLLLLALTSGASQLQAQTRQQFSLVGINQQQFIRMGISCLPPGPCRGIIRFHALNGDLIKQARYDLQAGQSAFVDLTPRELSFGDNNRAEVHPVVTSDSGDVAPAIQLISVETGRTETYVLFPPGPPI